MFSISKIIKKLLAGIVLTTGLISIADADEIDRKKYFQPLEYYKMGSGSPVILLPDYQITNNFYSKKFLQCLSKKHTVYLINYPHLTPETATIDYLAANVRETILDLGLERPTIIGDSFGASVALTLAYDYPHMINSSNMVLISPIVPSNQALTGLNNVSNVVRPNNTQLVNRDITLNNMFNQYLYDYSDDQFMSYKQEALFPRRPLLVSPYQATLQMEALNNWINNSSTINKYTHTKVPTQVLIAAKDKLVDPQVQMAYTDELNIKNVVVVDNVGHKIDFDDPEIICSLVD